MPPAANQPPSEEDASSRPFEVLDLPESGTDPEQIDYATLPRLQGKHTIISPAVRSAEPSRDSKIDLRDLRFQLHNYLVRHDGRFWCIWSDGPPIEDEPTQEVRYATSELFSTKTSRGDRVLILNANPKVGRREFHLAVSRDDRTFTRLAKLDIPTPEDPDATWPVSLRKKFQIGIATVQYPHVIEHSGHLWTAFSRNKKQIELLQVPLKAIEALLEK